MKRYKYILLGCIALCMSSCNDFLDTAPKDAISPNATWKTESDAQKFLVGCYDGWESGKDILYNDCASDFAYNNFPWEGYTALGNGTLSPSNVGHSFYDFTMIGRCNEFFANINNVHFTDEKAKANMEAQVYAIRAYQYFKLNWLYGGVPIIDIYASAEEAKVPRNTIEEVRALIHDDLDNHVANLSDKPEKLGYISKGAALAIRMREALYYEDWDVAKDRAQQIIDLGIYKLEENYADLFKVTNKDSKEIILAVQYIPSTKPLDVIGQMYNNSASGWSSIVPTQNLVNTYEMASGLTKEEEGSGYDPKHPYANRDPRLAMSVYFPGSDFIKEDGSISIYNPFNKELANGSANADYMTAQDNASKTGLTWAKYLNPITQYSSTGIWATAASPIAFRYAEVLLTYAEAENELNGPSAAVYDKLDAIRARVDMPAVDRAKYATKEKLRELIQRERAVEFAGEGLRRADILRWKTADGKMLAEKVLNGPLQRVVGTINEDLTADPFTRATVNVNASDAERLVENRSFKPHNRYYPISQDDRDSNPKLIQNEGY